MSTQQFPLDPQKLLWEPSLIKYLQCKILCPHSLVIYNIQKQLMNFTHIELNWCAPNARGLNRDYPGLQSQNCFIASVQSFINLLPRLGVTVLLLCTLFCHSKSRLWNILGGNGMANKISWCTAAIHGCKINISIELISISPLTHRRLWLCQTKFSLET